MKRPTFSETLDVLVKAYLNDTLAHKLCSACAVGNLVAAAMNTKPLPASKTSPTEFACFHFENGEETHWYYTLNHPGTDNSGLGQVQSTGYTIAELLSIEKAFEDAPGDPAPYGEMYRGRLTNSEWMFNGLMAVVDVLAEIHNVDLSVKESAKLQFVKQ